MANPNIPNGLVPVRSLTGPYEGNVNLYSTCGRRRHADRHWRSRQAGGTSQTINDVTYADVARAATGDVMVGVCTGAIPVTRDSTVYREASTASASSTSCDDPQVLFEVQEERAAPRSPRTISA
jgi:hypothetical protein